MKTIELKKDQVFYLEGDFQLDMFIVSSGKLMVSLRKGTEITPLAYIGANELIGEVSYFDHMPRSADIIAIEDTTLIQIPQKIKNNLPEWLDRLCSYTSTQIRKLDEITKAHGIKKKNVESIKPLSIEQQRHYLQLITQFQKSRE